MWKFAREQGDSMKKVSTVNVDAVNKDLAQIVDQMWDNRIGGIKASAKMGFLHWNSCFIINTNAIDSGTLQNARAALQKFDAILASPNPVGTGFELWIIHKWWKNPYK